MLAIIGDCVACHTAPGGANSPAAAPSRPPSVPCSRPTSPPIPQPGSVPGPTRISSARCSKASGRDGRHLYPRLPLSLVHTAVTTEDLLALPRLARHACAGTQRSSRNQLDFPFDIRAGMIFWNALYFRPGPFAPRTDKSDAWNRGAYLVEGLGHCGACHTPKTALGGTQTAQPPRRRFRPRLERPRARRRSPRRPRHLVDRRHRRPTSPPPHQPRRRRRPDGRSRRNSTTFMTQSDQRAIAIYLKDLPAPPRATAPPPDPATMQVGAAIYADAVRRLPHHGRCRHSRRLFPTLAGSAAVQAADPASVLHVILHGTRSAATDNPPPPARRCPVSPGSCPTNRPPRSPPTSATPGATPRRRSARSKPAAPAPHRNPPRACTTRRNLLHNTLQTAINAEGEKKRMHIGQRMGAEFIGTFWLVLGGCGSAVLAAAFPSLGIGFLGVALAFGLTVLTGAYAVGHISGGHFNPRGEHRPHHRRPLPGQRPRAVHHRASPRRHRRRRGALRHRHRQGRLHRRQLRLERLRRTFSRRLLAGRLSGQRDRDDRDVHLPHPRAPPRSAPRSASRQSRSASP